LPPSRIREFRVFKNFQPGKWKEVKENMNPTIQIEFPPEAADKIQRFKSGTGEKSWDNILREFENTLGVLPLDIKTQGVPGSPVLPAKVHAGAGG
jgi:hypothetical protein